MRNLIRRTAVLAGAVALMLGTGMGVAAAQPLPQLAFHTQAHHFEAAAGETASITLVSGNGQVGTQDPNVTVNDLCGGVGQAWIVSPFPGWAAPISGSQWVSPNPGYFGCGGVYQTHFTLPGGALSPSISVAQLADNSANASLNGNPPFITRNQPGVCRSDYTGPPITGSTSAGFVPGANTLSFDVDDCFSQFGANPTGLDFVATVSYGTSAALCKGGGWQTQTDVAGRSFRNQGDCVSYVTTGGRNPASGS